jgi:hypothetical protein
LTLLRSCRQRGPLPGRRVRAVDALRAGALALLVTACGARAGAAASALAPPGEPLDFAFGALDGSVVSGESTRGRATVLLFVTSYDLSSQVVARRLNEVLHRHQPRINAACVALESADHAVLVQTFEESLHLDYPVALADIVELRASPAFSAIDRVPILVILDRKGRERFRRYGVFETKELSEWLRAIED